MPSIQNLILTTIVVVSTISIGIRLYQSNNPNALEPPSKDSSQSNYPDFICTNGRDPAVLGTKKYLQEFSTGPCSPITITPGIAGTKLRVEIDCEVLRDFSPLIFSSCNWNTCQKSFWKFWQYYPESEYNLWIPDLHGPINIFSDLSPSNKECFTALINQDYFYDRNNKNVIDVPTPGLKVKIYGETTDTMGNSDCLMESICNILETTNIPWVDMKMFYSFEKVRRELERLGFISG
jgi:hypothetical protein